MTRPGFRELALHKCPATASTTLSISILKHTVQTHFICSIHNSHSMKVTQPAEAAADTARSCSDASPCYQSTGDDSNPCQTHTKSLLPRHPSMPCPGGSSSAEASMTAAASMETLAGSTASSASPRKRLGVRRCVTFSSPSSSAAGSCSGQGLCRQLQVHAAVGEAPAGLWRCSCQLDESHAQCAGTMQTQQPLLLFGRQCSC